MTAIFSLWAESLEIALKAKDPIYWNLLRGIQTAPEEPELYSEDLQQVLESYNLQANDPRGPERQCLHFGSDYFPETCWQLIQPRHSSVYGAVSDS